MLANIIDSRKNKYAAAKINVVIELSAHDNSITGADQHSWEGQGGNADVLYGLSLPEAIEHVNQLDGAHTIFLYDGDIDPMASSEAAG